MCIIRKCSVEFPTSTLEKQENVKQFRRVYHVHFHLIGEIILAFQSFMAKNSLDIRETDNKVGLKNCFVILFHR